MWPVTLVVPVVVALDYLGSASQGIKNVDQVAWPEQLVLIPFMVVGVAAGLWLLYAVPHRAARPAPGRLRHRLRDLPDAAAARAARLPRGRELLRAPGRPRRHAVRDRRARST